MIHANKLLKTVRSLIFASLVIATTLINASSAYAVDTDPPVFESVSVSPSVAHVGDTVTVVVKISEESMMDGGVIVDYSRPVSGFWVKNLTLCDDGLYRTTLEVTEDTQSGTWTIADIDMQDAFDNTSSISAGQVGSEKLSEGTFTVSNDVGDASISDIPAATYTGKEIKPQFDVSFDSNGTKLVEGKDYSIECSNNINAGTASVTVTGTGNFTGSKTVTFEIAPAEISEAAVASIPDQPWTGTVVEPKPEITYNGTTLVENKDYSVEYSGNVDVGPATVTVMGTGNFTGSKTTTFKIKEPTSMGLGRISGSTRYDTMSKLASRGSWKTGGAAVLASGENYPDALAASALAGAKDAPILLTGPGSLSSEAHSRLQTLHPKTVYIIGGTAAISSQAESQVRSLLANAKIIRLAGASRYETALKVAGQLYENSDTVIVTTGENYADALSISPYAFATSSPVVLCSPSTGLDANAMAVIRAGGYSKAIIVGGKMAVPSTVASQLMSVGANSITRLSGNTRYETSQKIADFELASNAGFTMDGVLLATGENFPDALSAGPLAGKTLSPLLLVDGTGEQAANYLKAYKGKAYRGTVVGGPNAVSKSSSSNLANALGLKVL